MNNLRITIIQKFKRCLNKLRIFLFKLIQLIKENKKTAILLLSFVPIIFLVYLYLFDAHIIVNDITLPLSIIESGENAESITQRSVIGIRQAAIDRLNKITDNTSDFHINPITGAAECLDMKFSMPEFVDSEMKMIEAAFARSGIPDIEVSPLKFSFSKIIIFIKKYFNLPFVDVYPALITDKAGYQLIIYASAPNDQKVTIKKTISSTKNLTDELTDAFAQLLAPEIFAYGKEAKDPSDIDLELYIAKNILRDRNKTALILAMQMDSLEKSRTQADSFEDKEKAFLISTELKNYDLSIFGNMQFIMKLNMLSSKNRFSLEYFNNIKRLLDSNKKIIVDEILKTLLEKYKVEAKLIYDSSPKTYFEDLFYGFMLNDLHDPINSLSVLRSGVMKLNEDPSKASQNTSSIKILYLMMLLYLDKIDEMESFIKVEKYENSYFTVNYRAKQLAYFDTLEAAMNVKRNQNEMAFGLLKDARLNDYPCVEQLLFGQLKGKNEFYSLMDVRYGEMEANGFRNFSLYNGWGIIKQETGKFQEAYEKYNTSLKYPGDKEWALLNWGWAAFEAKDYSQSIKKFRESLMIGLVPSAVYGLLNSLSAINDSHQFLIAYKQYFEALTEIKDENRKIQLSQMAYAHQCRIKDKSELSLLVEKTHLGLEKFDHEICGWLPSENDKNPTQTKLN